MLAIVLSDNIADGDFQGEWGLSIYIEYNGKNFLLDTGASNFFVQKKNKAVTKNILNNVGISTKSIFILIPILVITEYKTTNKKNITVIPKANNELRLFFLLFSVSCKRFIILTSAFSV